MTRVALIDRHDALESELDADTLVTSEYGVLARARELGRPCLLEHEVLSRDDIAQIQDRVARHRVTWAERLFGPRRGELLGFEGYLLDEFVDYDLTFPFVEIFTTLRACQSMLERLGPTSVLCEPTPTVRFRLIEKFFSERGVPVRAWPRSPGSPGRPASGHRRGTARRRRFLRPLLHETFGLRPGPAHKVPVYVSAEKVYTRALLAHDHERLAFHAHGPTRALRLHDLYFALTPSLRPARAKLEALRRGLGLASDVVDSASYVIDGIDVIDALRPALGWLLTGRMPRANPYRSALCFRNAIHLLDVARAIASLERIFRKMGIRLVVINQDSLRGGAVAALVARRLGIPSVVLQHGVPAEFFPLKADRMFFWGAYGVDFYKKQGVDEARLAVTGHPTAEVPTPASTGRALGPRGSKPDVPDRDHRHLVTYVGQPYTGLNPIHPPHGPSCHRFCFAEEARRHPADLFLIRPHTLEDPSAIRAWADALELPNLRVYRSQGLADLLRRSRVIVLHNSTVGLEALLLGKRILMVNFTGMPDAVPYGDSPNCAAAYSPEAFSELLDRELDRPTPFIDPREDRFVRGQIALGGARAISATHDALVDLVQETR
jgi:hypothetical protein